MPTLKVTLNNSGGELDCRFVNSEEDARRAALALISSVPYLADGDSITVTEVDETAAEQHLKSGGQK